MNVSFKKGIFLIAIVIFSGCVYRVLVSFGDTGQFDNLSQETGSSYIDAFMRQNFGFGLDVSDEENKDLGIGCFDIYSPKFSVIQKDSNYIVCDNNNRDGDKEKDRVFVGWMEDSFSKFEYDKKIADTILESREGEAGSATVTCKEDKSFKLNIKLPALTSFCHIKTQGGENLYYTTLFLYSSNIRNIVSAITFANIYHENESVRDELRDFSKKIEQFSIK